MACHRRPKANTIATTSAIPMAPIVSAESDSTFVMPSMAPERWSASQLVAQSSRPPIEPDNGPWVSSRPRATTSAVTAA